MSEPFRVICADPPWKFGDALPGDSRGAVKNYACMSVEEICAFPLPPLADDATLFLWRVAAMQQEALDVIKAWGFGAPKSEIVWVKKTVYGKRWFGMGRTVRAEHEICLIASRGRPVTLDRSIRSVIHDDLDVDGLSDIARRHSEKPEKFYTIVEMLRQGPYVELFARRERPGWTSMGDEVGVFG